MNEDEAVNFLKNIVKQNGDLDTHTTVPFYKKEAKAIETILDLYKQEKEKNSKIEKYIRSNEWAEDYEKSSCRTKILRILEE